MFVFDKSKQIDFLAIGRLCIDLNANEINRPMEEAVTFTKYVGGSPANIAIGMSRLGLKTGFIGKIADDQMGRFIINYLRQNQIDTTNVITDRSGGVTGLAFTEIISPTDCSILMYRDNAVDLKLEPKDIKEEYIKNAKALLISGTALSKSPSREAVFLALRYARRHQVVVFFDIDYRPYTWLSPEETDIYYNLVAEKCDVIIGTKEEFNMMGSIEPISSTDKNIAQKYFGRHTKMIVIKHGKDGSIIYTKKGEQYKAHIFPANVIKTFGAGDSYAAGLIYGFIQGWTIEQSMEFGSAAASIVISSHSCSDAMPTVEQVRKYIQKYNEENVLAKGD